MSKAVLARSGQSFKLLSDVLEPAEKVLSSLTASGPIRGRGRSTGLGRVREQAKSIGFEEGHREGFAAGLLEGKLQVEQATQGHIAAFAAALGVAAERVDSAIEDWYAQAEANLAGLGAAIAARVINDELKSDPERILEITRDAMREVSGVDSVRIRLNPFDAPAVREHIAEIQSVAPSVQRVEIVDDPAIEGGCRIESDSGVIDATIRAQIELALEKLRGDD